MGDTAVEVSRMGVSAPPPTPKQVEGNQTGSRRTQRAVVEEMKSTMDKLRMTTKAHVKFRKDNPIFYEQIPVLLPRLEKIEKNVYEPCTYCKYDPKSDGEYQKLVTRLSGNAQNSNQNGA